MNKLLLIVSLLTLSACNQTWQLETNLDKESIKNYFKPAQIQVMEPHDIPVGSTNIAAITGTSCQKTANDRPANRADATVQAKIAAAKLNATALVIDVCETQTNTEMPQCQQLMTCFARALKLPEPESK